MKKEHLLIVIALLVVFGLWYRKKYMTGPPAQVGQPLVGS